MQAAADVHGQGDRAGAFVLRPGHDRDRERAAAAVVEKENKALRSWVDSANTEGTDFPIQNLPFGVFRRAGSTEVFRGGVAIGDQIVDLAALSQTTLLHGAALQGAKACAESTLNAFMAQAAAHLADRGIDARWIAADASQPADIQRVVDETMARLGRIDILVNNAGATWGAPAEDYPLEAWDKVMNLNIRSLFLFAQAVGKAWMVPNRSGRVINVASIAGLSGSIWGFALAHGLMGLVGASATFAPLIADTALWWNRRRGIAVAICASGNYIAGALWPPIVQHGIGRCRAEVAPVVVGVDRRLRGRRGQGGVVGAVGVAQQHVAHVIPRPSVRARRPAGLPAARSGASRCR